MTIRCWPLRRVAAAKHAALGIGMRRHHRRARRAIVWVCVTLGAGGAGAVLPPLLLLPPLPLPPYSGAPSAGGVIASVPGQPIPEPSSLALLATALAAFAAWRTIQ